MVAGVPTGIVEEVICGSVGRCETAREKWSISTAMVTETRTDTLSVDTVVTGVSYWVSYVYVYVERFGWLMGNGGCACTFANETNAMNE